MNAAIRTLLVSTLLFPACDGGAKADAAAADAPKADAAKADAPKPDAAKPDADKAGAPKPGAPKPDAPKLDTAAAKIFPGQPGYDCGRLLSKVEIDSVCGTSLQEVTIDRSEGSREQVRCSRRWRNENKARTVSFIVGDYGTPEKAKGLTVPEDATDNKEFEGIGDQSKGYVQDRTSGIFWHTVRTAQGQYSFSIRSIITDSGDPLCTLDQLAELSREVSKRIEQVPLQAPEPAAPAK